MLLYTPGMTKNKPHTVILFLWVSAKFGTCTVASVTGTLVEVEKKCAHSLLNPRILSSTNVSFTLTTVQMPNLALTHTKRITVHCCFANDKLEFICAFARRLWKKYIFGFLQNRKNQQVWFWHRYRTWKFKIFQRPSHKKSICLLTERSTLLCFR
jgi:hypothetical protein